MTATQHRRGGGLGTVGLRTGSRSDTAAAVVFLAPTMLLVALTRLWPFVVTIQQAFGDAGWDITGVLGDLFDSDRFVGSVTTTLWFSAIINPLQILGALGLAVILTKKLPATGLWRTAIFLPVAVPPAVASVVWGLALRSPDGLINGFLTRAGFDPKPFLISPNWALWSIVIIASWVGVGYWMLFLIAGLRDIPAELMEAASLDGATGWKKFWRITVPLLRRPLLFVLVADTVANFLLFVQVQLLTQGGPAGSTNLLMHEIYQQAFVFGNEQTAAAEVLVLLALMTIIVAIQARLLKDTD